MIIMFILFANFYIHEYIRRNNDKKQCKQILDISEQNQITIINKYE